MNISAQYELMAVMNLWLNVLAMYFVFASVEKVENLYGEMNHDLLVYRRLTEWTLTVRLPHWVSTSSIFLYRGVEDNSPSTFKPSFGNYVDFCLFMK